MNDVSPDGMLRVETRSRFAGPLRSVLLESRQRWRDMVSLAAALAFETDAQGRFTFIVPEQPLGWSAAKLLGQAGEVLLAEVGATAGCNPFRPRGVLRRQRAWLRRADGTTACLVFAAAPLLDRHGRTIGARGLGMDITEQDSKEAQAAAALRRGEVIDHILWRMRQEVMAPRMMQAALHALLNALGAEGAAVVGLLGEVATPRHEVGAGARMVLDTAAVLLREADPRGPALAGLAKDRPVLVAACQTRFGEVAGLAVWRAAGQRQWDFDDQLLAGAATSIVRVVLEHEAIQRELACQARTDPLTGLLNRRAFLEELPRHIERLERDRAPGTLMFADIDYLKSVNDGLGHELGDQLLCCAAELLRNAVRPTDLVARLGGDEFAVWLNGADHLTAAERAEGLRVNAPRVFADLAEGSVAGVGFSIGIATRQPGGGEEIESVMRRADLAMYEVKRAGKGHWRVSHEEAQ